MNRGYRWPAIPAHFICVVRRQIPPPSKRTGYECVACGRVFCRKHVRYTAHGWVCRDRCDRIHKGLV